MQHCRNFARQISGVIWRIGVVFSIAVSRERAIGLYSFSAKGSIDYIVLRAFWPPDSDSDIDALFVVRIKSREEGRMWLSVVAYNLGNL